jgi:hypothetical protein
MLTRLTTKKILRRYCSTSDTKTVQQTKGCGCNFWGVLGTSGFLATAIFTFCIWSDMQTGDIMTRLYYLKRDTEDMERRLGKIEALQQKMVTTESLVRMLKITGDRNASLEVRSRSLDQLVHVGDKKVNKE